MAAPAGGAPAPPLGPGDLQAVFQCLQSALSHEPSTQKQAEAALRELETRPGFCSCLAVRVTCSCAGTSSFKLICWCISNHAGQVAAAGCAPRLPTAAACHCIPACPLCCFHQHSVHLASLFCRRSWPARMPTTRPAGWPLCTSRTAATSTGGRGSLGEGRADHEAACCMLGRRDCIYEHSQQADCLRGSVHPVSAALYMLP